MENIVYEFSRSSDGNMAFGSKDSPEMIIKNRNKLLHRLSLTICKLVTVNQVHGSKIHLLDTQNNTEKSRVEADAIITNLSNIAIGVMTADCLPVIIYSKLHKGIGVIHAGRVGSHLSISSMVLNVFLNTFDTTPDDISVILGPCIGKCCYEIGSEELTPFMKLQNKFPKIAARQENGKWKLDIREVNRIQILEAGVPEKNIISTEKCTSCNSEYFSYRKNKTAERFMSVISILTASKSGHYMEK